MNKKTVRQLSFFLLLAVLLAACNGNEGANEERRQAQSIPDDTAGAEKSSANQLKAVNDQLQNDINNAALYRKRALIYAGKKDYQAAISDMERAIQLEPDSQRFHLTKADFLFKLNKFDEAYTAVENCLDAIPEGAECYLKLAQYNLFYNKLEKAIEYADKALKINPYNADAYFLKGIVFLESGDTATAKSSFQTAVEQDQNHLMAYLQLGLLHYIENDPLAEGYYKNALRIDSNNIESWYNLGMYYQRNEMYNEALKAYTRITKINPKHREAYFNLGYIHLQDLKVYRVAAGYFTDAIEASPEYAEAYYNRGYSYELMGDVQKAEKDYLKALEIKPDYSLPAKGLSRVRKEY